MKKKIKYSNKLRGCWAWKKGYELQFMAHIQSAYLTFHSHMRWLTLVYGGPSAWFIGSWFAATWQLGSGGIWWTMLGTLHLNTWKAKPNNCLGDLGFEGAWVALRSKGLIEGAYETARTGRSIWIWHPPI